MWIGGLSTCFEVHFKQRNPQASQLWIPHLSGSIGASHHPVRCQRHVCSTKITADIMPLCHPSMTLYRNVFTYISHSAHIPVKWRYVNDMFIFLYTCINHPKYITVYTHTVSHTRMICDDILHTIHGWYGHAACISCSGPLELYIVLPYGRASQPRIRKYSFSSCFCLPLEMWFGCVQEIGSPKFHWFSTEMKHVHVFLGVMF